MGRRCKGCWAHLVTFDSLVEARSSDGRLDGHIRLAPNSVRSRRLFDKNITDSLVTFLIIFFRHAGGNPMNLTSIDGLSQWASILNGSPSERTVVLHNIDDRLGYAALRQGNFKLVKGKTSLSCAIQNVHFLGYFKRNDLQRQMGRLVRSFRARKRNPSACTAFSRR